MRPAFVAVLLCGCAVAHPAPVATPATKYAARDVRIEPVRTREHVRDIYFADELAPVEDALGEALTRAGYRPLPLAELRQLYRDTQAGRLPGAAAQCAVPPPPAGLAELVYDGASAVETDVDCGEADCTATVIVRAAPTGPHEQGAETARFTATLPRTGGPAAWAERVRGAGLVAVAAQPEAGALGLGMSRAQLIRDVTTSGWDAKPGFAQLPGREPQLRACARAAPPWTDWWLNLTVIEVDAAGHATRCEPEIADHLPAPGFDCVCEQLRQVDWGSGAAGRRARFELDLNSLDRAPRPRSTRAQTASLGEFRASDPSVLLGRHDQHELASCLDDLVSNGELHARASFDVGGDGVVRSLGLVPPADLPPTVLSCLTAGLGQMRFPCPLGGGAHVEATLTLTVRALPKQAP